MVWFIVVIALVVVAGVGAWLMYRRRRGPVTSVIRRQHFNPDDVRGRVETQDLMGNSFRTGIRKNPGSRNF